MAIKHYTILKMIEFNIDEISENMVDFLNTCQPSYRYQIMDDEHLYRVEDIWEKEEPDGSYPDNIKEELAELEKLLLELDCTYFRIYVS